jgi:hypothetical protein
MKLLCPATPFWKLDQQIEATTAGDRRGTLTVISIPDPASWLLRWQSVDSYHDGETFELMRVRTMGFVPYGRRPEDCTWLAALRMI